MQNFADLRVDQASSKGDDSFWPSFTDIMTVIVMIFLIATSMLILQNWKLIAELTDTIEAKKEVQALAQFTSQENQSLEERLIQAESQLSLTRLNMLQAQDDNAELLAQKEQQLKALQALTQKSQELDLKLTEKEQRYLLLNHQFEVSQQENLSLGLANQKQIETINKQNSTLLNQLTLLSSKKIELATLEGFKKENINTLSKLNTQLSSLQVKYNKLFKPARSSRGKVVVELTYNKAKNVLFSQLKLPNAKSFSRYSNKQLHQKLTELKKKHGKKLYIKIIFPEDSGLSYNEAWKFASDVLKKYDYYEGQ